MQNLNGNFGASSRHCARRNIIILLIARAAIGDQVERQPRIGIGTRGNFRMRFSKRGRFPSGRAALGIGFGSDLIAQKDQPARQRGHQQAR